MCTYDISNKSCVKCSYSPEGCWSKEAVYNSSNITDALRVKLLASNSMGINAANISMPSPPVNVYISIDSSPSGSDYLVQFSLPLDEVNRLMASGMERESVQKLFDDALDDWLF